VLSFYRTSGDLVLGYRALTTNLYRSVCWLISCDYSGFDQREPVINPVPCSVATSAFCRPLTSRDTFHSFALGTNRLHKTLRPPLPRCRNSSPHGLWADEILGNACIWLWRGWRR